MKFELSAAKLAQILNGTVEGDPDVTVTSFARIENGKSGQLCFYANPKYEQYVYTCDASILLVNSDFQPAQPVRATLVRVENAYSSLAVLLKYVSDLKKKYRRHRSLRSHIACSARLGRKVWVGAFSWIGRNCRIGGCTRIYEQVYIGEGCTIGSYCTLYPGVKIYPGTVIGDRVILHENCVVGSDGFGNAPRADGSWEKIEHLGNVIIGNDVEVGACTTIDRAEMESTVIEDGARIDNLCQIAHNVVVGKNTAMAAQCGIAGSAKIGEGCILAGQVGIVGHISVADHTTVGAQSGVTSSVRKSGTAVLGSPAFDIANYKRSYVLFKQMGQRK